MTQYDDGIRPMGSKRKTAMSNPRVTDTSETKERDMVKEDHGG